MTKKNTKIEGSNGLEDTDKLNAAIKEQDDNADLNSYRLNNPYRANNLTYYQL
jgi:hypothetical protein